MEQALAQPTDQVDLQRLAYDVALEYDTDDDICLQHGIHRATLQTIKANPVFRQAVLTAERDITETGKEFKLKARKLSSLVLEELSHIAMAEDASHSDRINAIKELTKLAGYGKEEGAGAGNAFQVNINLG